MDQKRVQTITVSANFPLADCPSADLTGDCFVDFEDFALMADQWLTTDPCFPDDMIYIPAGGFSMGDAPSAYSDERPVHPVKVDSFYMSKYEVTYQEYCDYLNFAYSQNWIEVNEGIVYGHGGIYPYCDSTRIHFVEPLISVTSGKEDHPMERVSWYGAAAYCNWLSLRGGREACYNLSTWDCDFSANGYRLATEADPRWFPCADKTDPKNLGQYCIFWLHFFCEKPPSVNRSTSVCVILRLLQTILGQIKYPRTYSTGVRNAPVRDY